MLEAEALNGKPVVYFDGENDLLRDTGFKLSQPNTAFVVGKTDAKFGAFFDGTESYYYRNMVQRSYPEQWSMSAGSGVVGGKADEEPHIFTALFDEANSELREDGEAIAEGDAGSFPLKGVTLGASFNDANFLKGDIAAVLVFNRRLSTSEVEDVEAYLQDKYFGAGTGALESPSYAPAGEEGSAGEGTEAVAVSESAEGLASGTTYRYRAVASSEAGTSYGAGESIATPPRYLSSFGEAGSEPGQLSEPRGLTLDSEGDVWIADTGNNRIQEFDAEGGFVQEFGSLGAGDGKLDHPSALALDGSGDVWVADTGNDRTEEFSPEGEYLAQFGEAGTGEAQLSEPRGLALGSAGTMWVADTQNDRIEKWLPAPSTTSYAYDQAGNLTAVERPEAGEAPAIDETYAYNGTGLRASQTVSGATSHLTWDTSGGLPLLLDDGHASYIYGPEGLPIEQISEEEPTFYHHDQLGSTRMLTNASGEATATFSYSAYGQPTGSTGTQTTPLGYAGQLTNEQSGLIYMRARVYDPVTGQFLTRDPLEPVTRLPYGYVYENPVNASDPTGLWLGTPLPSPGEVAETVAHAALDLAAVPPYAKYFAANKLANAIESVGNQFGVPGQVIAHGLNIPLALAQAEGLCEDALIDWVKGHTVNDEPIGDEGKVGYINPFHEYLPGPLKGPKTYLPGIHRNGEVDFTW